MCCGTMKTKASRPRRKKTTVGSWAVGFKFFCLFKVTKKRLESRYIAALSSVCWCVCVNDAKGGWGEFAWWLSDVVD